MLSKISLAIVSLLLLSACVPENVDVSETEDTILPTNTESKLENPGLSEAGETTSRTGFKIIDDSTDLGTIETDIDTSDWLTYTNEEHGFELKYPVGWTPRYGSHIWFEGSNGSLYTKFSKDDDFEADLFLDRKYDEKKIVNGEVVRKFIIDDRRDHGCQDLCPKTIAYKFRKGQMGYSLYSSYDEDMVEAIVSTFRFIE